MNDEIEITGSSIEKAVMNALDKQDGLYAQAIKMLQSMVDYKDMQTNYVCALKTIKTKFDVLNTEFNVKYKRNPINSISTRLKSTESLINKLTKKDIPCSLENIEKHINDIAGIRVICSYIDDIYEIAEALLKQDDVKLVECKDYIKNPKPNGYRSLHLIVRIPVYFADSRKEMKVEVQIRTIAMDFWASLEHQIKYKQVIPDQAEVISRLKQCAELIARTDEEMLELRRKIESAADAPSEEEKLFERLRKIDARID